ncbi:MAG: carbon-nitrogen hydrolase family protein [Planctomycetota bacterium]
MTAPRVAALHWTFDPADPAASRRGLLDHARRAFAHADLVVLPELPWGPFVPDPTSFAGLLEAPDGPTVRALGEVARDRGVLVAGLALREAGGLFNAQVVLDADGSLVGVYRKHHLWGPDAWWALPGPTPGAVVETSLGPLGLLICHDVVYPETVAAVAARRPFALAFSTAWVGDGAGVPDSWAAAAHALDGAPFVAANRGGAEGPFEFADPSAVLRAVDGELVAQVGPRTTAPYTVTLTGVLR